MRPLRIGLAVAALVDAALVGLGLVLIPTGLAPASGGTSGGIRALAGVLLVLFIYGLIGYLVTPAVDLHNPGILRLAMGFGLAAIDVFAAEIILEYVLVPNSAANAQMGLVEYTAIFVLLFAAGFWSARASGRARSGVLAAIWTALIASLVWYGVLLAVYYTFHGTPAQAQVMAAEGNLEDFQRSGMSDFDAFLYQDFLGAGFFHLTLLPAIGAVLGGIAGLLGRVTRRLGREKSWDIIAS